MKDFPKLVGRLTKTLPQKDFHRFPLLGKIVSMLIPSSPSCLFCVSGVHRECNHGSTRSTCPIMVHERTATCKSQLEPIVENPGNTLGWNKLLASDSQTDYTGI